MIENAKGRGVQAREPIRSGAMLVEYKGDWITGGEAARRELAYAVQGAGCFMFYFRHRGATWCLDATDEERADEFGVARLFNHSRVRTNVVPRKLVTAGQPHIWLFARRDILAGEELLFDYGDRDHIEELPWLLD